MNRIAAYGAAVLLAAGGTSAGAQVTKSMTSEMKVVTVTVEAIERASRDVTVKKPDGTYEELHVPAEIKRFDQLKVGDTVTARYYETIVLRLKAPGEKDVDATDSAVSRAEGRPAGTAAVQRTITATITAIDPTVPSITFTGPRGWTYSSRVEDTKALAKVKTGDKVDITWTAALLMSLEDAR